MRDFDQEIAERHAERERLLERKFKVGGETFILDVNPSLNTLREFDEGESSSEGMTLIDFLIAAIGRLIVDKDRPRYVKMMAKKDLALTSIDLEALYRDLIGMAYARPTEASLPSQGGDATTGTSSTETPSTEPAEAAAA